MNTILHKLLLLLHLPVGKQHAIAIARRTFTPPEAGAFKVFPDMPEFIRLYNKPAEPCWYIIAPWNDGLDGKILRSSHLIVISKINGKVLYDGSAGDEG